MWKWVKRLLVAGVAAVLLAVVTGVAVYLYYDRDLPSVEALRNYQPPQVSKVFCADGSLCAEYFKERRTWVDVKTLPAHVRNSFLAAEDADFYSHEGLDYVGMLRAFVKGIIPGNRPHGASTISQQACRNLLLTQERTASRKIREWILTPRMEKALTKDQILNLYINQIYFGHNRYGIEEAALFYFGKHAKDLSIGEAAVLAGTVQLPERINPLTNVVRAKKRQQYVLSQLALHKFLPQAVVDKEMNKPIVLAPRPPDPVGPYYIEEIRRMLVARYGEDALLSKGLRIEIAMDPKLQKAADEAVQQGLELLDHRMGYSGALGTIPQDRFALIRQHIEERLANAGRRAREEAMVADLTHVVEQTPTEETDAQASAGVTTGAAAAVAAVGKGAKAEAAPRKPEDDKPGQEVEEGAEEKPEGVESEAPTPERVLAGRAVLTPLTKDIRVAGYVTKVDDGAKKATVDLIGRTAQISLSTVTWARPRGVGKWTQAPSKISDIFKPGDVVRVKILNVTPAPQPLEATLDQIPEVQGALVAIDPTNRHVVAMTGGYDFDRSPFNRVTQAHRQPGSSFKPFLYGAAIASEQYTSLTQVNDAPEPIRDPQTGKVWRPQNYEKGEFEGPMTLRAALTKSKNTVSVRLIEALTPQVAIDFARKAGIHSEMPDSPTLALGTGEVTMMEIANAYATLQSLGKYADPVTLIRVKDASGTVLEEHQAAFEEVMRPAVAYMTTSLMRSVVEEGTATQVKELHRPAAGKTGTASEYRDAWFTGYTVDYVASAWVGFDDHSSLGTGETGGRAALPLWLSFMKAAHEGKPERDFDVPPGVSFVRIDPATGLLAGDSVPGRLEPFLDGTAPTAIAPPPSRVDPNRFFLEDTKGGG